MINKILLFFCLVLIGLLTRRVNASRDDLWTKEQCRETFRNVKTIKEFQYYTNRLINFIYIDNTVSIYDDIMMDAAVLNRCMHSVDGLGDLLKLKEIVKQIPKTHSVCQSDFAEILLAFDKRMNDNIAHNKILFFTSKQKHRLSHFFSLLAGQVVLTCKKSLAKKLEQAEKENSEIVQSIDLIIEFAARSERERSQSTSIESKKLSAGINMLLNIAMDSSTKLFNRVENIILLDSLKPAPDATYALGMTVNNVEKLNAVMKTKNSCYLVENYARNSIYTIAKLAWKGYLARDEANSADTELNDDQRVQKWIKVIQYCQGVLMLKIHLDLEQEELIKLDRNALNNSEHEMRIDLVKDEHYGKNDQARVAHIYEEEENFGELDCDLRCYTYSGGIKSWLMKQAGEFMRTKFVKIDVHDPTYMDSLFKEYQDPENDVEFGGTAGTDATAADPHH